MSALFHIAAVCTVLLYLTSMCLYGGSLLSYGRTDGGSMSGRTSGRSMSLLPRKILLCGLGFHVAAIILQGNGIPSFPFTLSLISCLVVGIYLALEQRLRIESLGLFVAPLALLFAVGSAILFHQTRSGVQSPEQNILLWLHIAAVVVGHAAFVFAFGVSVALIVQETLIKEKRFTRLQQLLPSLKVLDDLNGRMLQGGFLFMAVGVSLGVLFGFVHKIEFWGFDTRIFWSLLTLIIYALLLTARSINGLRGRRAAWLSVLGFSTVVASFFGLEIGEGFHVH